MTARRDPALRVKALRPSIFRATLGNLCTTAPAPAFKRQPAGPVLSRLFNSKSPLVGVEYAGKWSAVMKVVSKSAASRTRQALSLPAYSIAGLAGTSFKHEHLSAILTEGRQKGFFEVHAENYMGAGDPPHYALERIRRDHPDSVHGVC